MAGWPIQLYLLWDISQGREGLILTSISRSQPIIDGSQGRDLLAIPHSINLQPRTHFTAKEVQQDPWRMLFASWLMDRLLFSWLSYTVQDYLL